MENTREMLILNLVKKMSLEFDILQLSTLERIMVVTELLEVILIDVESSFGKGKGIELLNNFYNITKDSLINSRK